MAEDLKKAVQIRNLVGGMNLEVPRSELRPNESPNIVNFRFLKGALRQRHGYSQLGLDVDGAVIGIGELVKNDQTRTAVVATTDKVYKLSGGEWAEIPAKPGTSYSGSDDVPVRMVVAQDQMVIANGADPLVSWDGVASEFSLLSSDAPAARFMVNFAGRLVVLDTFESGTRYPWRLRWTAREDIDDWTSTGSGYEDLSDTPQRGAGLVATKNALAIFKERTILTASQTGNAYAPFNFQTKVEGVGAMLVNSPVFTDGGVFFVGHEDVYMYDFGTVRPVGGKVRHAILDSINPLERDKAFAYYHGPLREVWLFVPTGEATYPNLVWVYNLNVNAWSQFEFADGDVQSMGTYRTVTTATWDNMLDSWDSATDVRWNSMTNIAESPKVIMGTNGKKVMEFGETTHQDNLVDIESIWESADFDLDLPDTMKTLMRVKVGYKRGQAAPVFVAASVDSGATWEDEKPITLLAEPGGALKYAFYDIIKTGEKMSIRLRHTSSGDVAEFNELIPMMIVRGVERAA